MNQVEFGKELIKIRKSKALTQTELADKCELSLRTIQRIESGDVKPRAFTIKRLSQVLDYNFLEKLSPISEKAQLRYNFGKWSLQEVKNLFNFKTNIMRKLSILTVTTTLIVSALFLFINTSNAEDRITDLTNFLTIEVSSNISQKDAFEKIRSINKQVGYHNIQLDLLEFYTKKSDYNFNVYVHFAKLISSFGHSTQLVMEIANITFMTYEKCDLFIDISSLIFLNSNLNKNALLDLAKKAQNIESEEDFIKIKEILEKYKSEAKYKNLTEAFNNQE